MLLAGTIISLLALTLPSQAAIPESRGYANAVQKMVHCVAKAAAAVAVPGLDTEGMLSGMDAALLVIFY